MKKGFTLIELLVVVLIIGILAAIALPMYNSAVKKSRAVQVIVNLRSLANAADRYYLESAQWPTTFEQIDIGIGVNCSTETCVQGDYAYTLLNLSTKQITAYLGDSASITAFALSIQLEDFVVGDYLVKKGKLRCNTRNKDEYIKFCKLLGAKDFFVYGGSKVYIVD